MSKNNIQFSSFSLAKRKEIIGDDFYEIKVLDDLTIAIVCDGVGSANKGAQAAKKVTKSLMHNFKTKPKSWSIEKALNIFIKSINSILYEKSIEDYESAQLVTTLAIVIIEGNRLYGANVGDSRIYLQRDNKLNKLSYDHIIGGVGFENVLSSAIGIDKEVEVFYFENNLEKEDKILLCSDGLYSLLSTEILKENINKGAYNLVKKASLLVNDNLPDDTTALVLNILDTDEITKIKQLKLLIPLDLKKDDVIDDYILKESLIGNNRTWVCQKKGLEYVIKFAPIEAIHDEEVLDLFAKEIWNAKRLKAGFFVKTIVPKNRTARYYIMPKLKGINLKKYLKKRTLSIEESISLAKTLLHMSQYLLKFDLVHGDIKPENIMVLERKGKRIFKIIDFGSITELYSLNSKAGTPSYLAPERFKEGQINEKTEIFSIGITLYEALTNKYAYKEIEPFQNPTFKTAKSVKNHNPNVPSWLEAVILRAISIPIDRRYNNYSLMLFELENPLKVKAFFEKDAPLLKKNPLKFYQFSFYFLLIINFILLVKLL